MNINGILQETWKIVTLTGIQYTLGRRGSYPYGLLIQFTPLKISIIVIASDILQTYLLLNFLGYVKKLLGRAKILKRVIKKKERESKRQFGEKLKKFGVKGLFLVSALPYTGGALSGSLLAVSLKIDKRRAFVIIILGCICSTVFYYLVFCGILAAWE